MTTPELPIHNPEELFEEQETPEGAEKNFFEHQPITDLPESAAVCNGDLRGEIIKDGVTYRGTINCTQRGRSMVEALNLFLDGVKYGNKMKFHLMYPIKEPPPLKSTPGTTGPKTPPQKGAVGQPVTSESDDSQGGVFHAVKMVFTPKPDNKCEVGFFESGHRYADIRTTRAIPALVDFLAPLGAFDEAMIGKADEYSINCLVHWVPGKLNSAGNPFKDIVRLEVQN